MSGEGQAGYPLEIALFQWEDGSRRLSEQESARGVAGLDRAVESVRDELRRRLGPTYTVEQLVDLYSRGTDWCLAAAMEAEPSLAQIVDPQAITDGAFWRHLRGASDWAGGRLRIPDDDEGQEPDF